MTATTRNHYDLVAGCYDGLAALYGLGQIGACKRWQLRAIKPGDRVLYAGAGRGDDALLAARGGARVTVVDLSPRMLARARRRFAAAGLGEAVEVICGDILDHARPGGYDVVAANFFLNVFAEPVMAEVLRHLARQLRPGGRLLIADFAPATGAPLPRALRWLYFGCAVLAFRVLAGNALHPMYEYPAQFPSAGLLQGESRGFRLLGRGPVVFRTLTGVRVG